MYIIKTQEKSVSGKILYFNVIYLDRQIRNLSSLIKKPFTDPAFFREETPTNFLTYIISLSGEMHEFPIMVV